MSNATRPIPAANVITPRDTSSIVVPARRAVKRAAAGAAAAGVALALGAPALRAQDAPPPAVAGGLASITEAEVGAHVRFFADPGFRGRGAGTAEGYRAATVIAGEFARLGLYPAGPERKFFQEFALPEGRTGRNVCALLPGSGGERAGEIVIVSAHYDHLPPAKTREGGEMIFPGADDNASGVAALLELAEAFAEAPVAPARSLLFLAFDGEEGGLRGSAHWAAEPTVALERIAAMTTMDMLSRDFLSVMDDTLYVVGTERSDLLRAAVVRAEAGSGLVLDVAATELVGPRSDHWHFFARKIPFLFFSTSQHRDYHRPTDTAARSRTDKLWRATRVIYRILTDVADAEGRPVYRADPYQGPEELRTLMRVSERVLERRDRFEMTATTEQKLRDILTQAREVLAAPDGAPDRRAMLKIAAGMLLFQIREKE